MQRITALFHAFSGFFKRVLTILYRLINGFASLLSRAFQRIIGIFDSLVTGRNDWPDEVGLPGLQAGPEGGPA